MEHKIVNLSKFPVNLLREDGSLIQSIEPSGSKLRVKEDLQVIGEINGIPVNQMTYSSEGQDELPPEIPGTIYLVSVIALQSLPSSRTDFYTADKAVKDESGKIIGHMALSRPSVYGRSW
jgi:hypothetical protein